MVGLANALDLIVTGRMITAEEALKMGYLREVVPDDQLMARANEIAHDIAHNCSAISVAQSRRILLDHLASDLETILAIPTKPPAGCTAFRHQRRRQSVRREAAAALHDA